MDISRKFGKSGNRLEKVEERRKELKTIEKLSMTEIHKLADLALKVISVKVKHYAGLMNVQYGRITIRNQKTRWGSCSSIIMLLQNQKRQIQNTPLKYI